MKVSIIRHVRACHNITIDEILNICRSCQRNIGKRPTSHKCPFPHCIAPPTVPFPYQCTECQDDFPTRQTLKNHGISHVKKSVKAKTNLIPVFPKPRTRKIHTNPSSEIQQRVDDSNHSKSQPPFDTGDESQTSNSSASAGNTLVSVESVISHAPDALNVAVVFPKRTTQLHPRKPLHLLH